MKLLYCPLHFSTKADITLASARVKFCHVSLQEYRCTPFDLTFRFPDCETDTRVGDVEPRADVAGARAVDGNVYVMVMSLSAVDREP